MDWTHSILHMYDLGRSVLKSASPARTTHLFSGPENHTFPWLFVYVLVKYPPLALRMFTLKAHVFFFFVSHE